MYVYVYIYIHTYVVYLFLLYSQADETALHLAVGLSKADPALCEPLLQCGADMKAKTQVRPCPLTTKCVFIALDGFCPLERCLSQSHPLGTGSP